MSSTRTAPVFFDAKKVRQRLTELKAAANGADLWWAQALAWSWASPREAANCIWWNLTYTDEAGIAAPLQLKDVVNRHVGRMMPNTAEALSLIQQEHNKNGRGRFEVRKGQPAVQFTKYHGRVQTEKDGITLLPGEAEKLAADEKRLNNVYAVAELVNEAWMAECKARIVAGDQLITLCEKTKEAKGSAAGVLATYAKAAGKPAAPGTFIISVDQKGIILRLFPGEANKAHIEAILKTVITVPLKKVISLVADTISVNTAINGGQLMANPMVRITVPCDEKKNTVKLIIRDMSKDFEYKDPKTGRVLRRYEVATVRGPTGEPEPITTQNIHLLFPPGVSVTGIVKFDTACASGYGLSMPRQFLDKGEIGMVVGPAVSTHLTQDDLEVREDSDEPERAEAAADGAADSSNLEDLLSE